MNTIRKRAPLLTSCTVALAFAIAPAWARGQQDSPAPSTSPTPQTPAAPAPSNTPSDAELRTRFTGTFVSNGGAREREAIARAIDRATDGMSFITRPIARGRLEDVTVPPRRITISFPPSKIRVNYNDGRIMESRDNGDIGQFVREDGERVQLRQKFVRGMLGQLFKAEDGQRRNDYALDASGRRMTVHVRLFSPRLPRNVLYTLSYVRQ